MYFKGSSILGPLCFAVFFSTLGYLPVNFPKARVFMGDVGSIFLGNLFAAVVIWQARSFKEFLLLLAFQGTLYIDCISTIFLRISKNENVLQAHNKHLYQRLVHQFKWSHTRVTLLFSLFQLAMGLIAIWLFHYSLFYLILLWIIVFLLYWFIRYRLKLT
jgi:UDP-N-acetylmuramyl pentapeptide phosphotransferase/UDP-N-acetylglucosamine-1-phosphate transferase